MGECAVPEGGRLCIGIEVDSWLPDHVLLLEDNMVVPGNTVKQMLVVMRVYWATYLPGIQWMHQIELKVTSTR